MPITPLRNRGLQPQTINSQTIQSIPTNPDIRDVIIHAAICRIANTDDTNHEFLTELTNNIIEADIPDETLDKLVQLSIGPKIGRYFSWLTGSFTNLRKDTIQFTIGNTTALTVGLKGIGVQLGYDCTITRVDVFSDDIGSIEIDIWKKQAELYPPTIADSITGISKPTLANSKSSTDTTLLEWDTRLNVGDILFYNIDLITNIKIVTIIIHILKDNI